MAVGDARRAGVCSLTGGGTPVLTDDVGPYAADLLQLDASASGAFDAFVFGDDGAAADALRREAFARGVADYSPPHGRVVTIAGAAAGMFAVLDAASLRRRRLSAALAVGRILARTDDPEQRRRFTLAGTVNVRPEPDDAVLARIAVAPAAFGRGLGSWLLARADEEAASIGARRLVLDVADDNHRACAFYARHGFVEIARAVASDDVTGRRLTYLHLVRPVAPRDAR
jgi:ribosomal protein S18 acetylase RimI-like enzyme